METITHDAKLDVRARLLETIQGLDATKKENDLLAKFDEKFEVYKAEITDQMEASNTQVLSMKDEILDSIKGMKEDNAPKLLGHQEDAFKFNYTQSEIDGFSQGQRNRIAINKMISTPAEEQGEKANIAKQMQEANDVLYLAKHYTGLSYRDLNAYKTLVVENNELAKAIDTSTTGVGADWVPVMMSSDFIERMEREYVLAGMFQQFTIPGGTKSVDFPAAGAAISLFEQVSASSSDDPQELTAHTPASTKRTLTPVKFGGRVEIDSDAFEDSIIDVLRQVTIPELTQNAAFTVDYVIVNGDTASTHQDSDIAAASAVHAAKAWDGLRKIASVATLDASNGNLVPDDLLNILSQMSLGRNIYNRKLDDIGMVTSNVAYINYHRAAPLITQDLAGTDSTFFNGFLSNFMGPGNFQLNDSAVVRNDLNATGVYDATTTDRTTALVFHKRSFIVGTKRAVTIKSDENIVTDRRRVVLTMRIGFMNKFASTEPDVGEIFNVNA
tara:strand:- start:2339 stop:3835 length:1497 start_codon:yes stop_codon:yes gene_type:complete